ncbi:MAG: DUF4382 domain-containing protein [Patescibacteria group bacterium]
MNKTLGIIILILVVLGGVYLLTSNPSSAPVTSDNTNQNTGARGRVVFSVTDAAANMSAISEINMKVSSVAVHSATSGWMTVSTTPKTYSLLELNAESKSELLADADIKAGTYDQVRLMVDSVTIKTTAGATKTAKLPSGELKINTNLVVNADETASLNFDFLADKSLHITGNGSYIFAPVVKTETKSDANVSVDANSVVTVTGGRLDDTKTIGMDIDGSVKLNFQIDAKKKLNLDSNGVIKIEGTVSGLLN